MIQIISGECASAQYRTGEPLSINDTIGTCSLSKLERGARPQAYRSSMYRDEYLQDQCHNISKSPFCKSQDRAASKLNLIYTS